MGIISTSHSGADQIVKVVKNNMTTAKLSFAFGYCGVNPFITSFVNALYSSIYGLPSIWESPRAWAENTIVHAAFYGAGVGFDHLVNKSELIQKLRASTSKEMAYVIERVGLASVVYLICCLYSQQNGSCVTCCTA